MEIQKIGRTGRYGAEQVKVRGDAKHYSTTRPSTHEHVTIQQGMFRVTLTRAELLEAAKFSKITKHELEGTTHQPKE